MLYKTTLHEDINHHQPIENQLEEIINPPNSITTKCNPKDIKSSSKQKQLLDQIHSQAIEAANQFRKSESHLIEALEQVEQNKVHLHQGFSSLFQYAVQSLKLAENTAYILITIMRKTREVPELKKEITNGNISISNARRVASVITVENQNEWLQKAATLSQRQLEKEIASTNPLHSVPERTKYINHQRLKLELGISETHLLKVRRAQDLLSKTKSKHVSLEETLIELTEFFLHHKDPNTKAKRIIAKKGASVNNPNDAHKNAAKHTSPNHSQNHLQNQLWKNRRVVSDEKSNSSEPSSSTQLEPSSSTQLEPSSPTRLESSDNLNSTKNTRTPIPATILHQVYLRDQGKCTYSRPGGQKCNHSRWTEIHHIIPIASGGIHSLDNLTTLCSAHHRWIHRKK